MLIEKTKPNLLFYSVVFVTGTSILIMEILGARIIATNYGNTVYVWSALISTTILSLAIGYWLGGKIKNLSIPLAVGSATLLVPLSVMTGTLDIGATQVFGVVGGSMISSIILFSPFLILTSTTSPYIIKQITTNLSNVGKNSGNIFAVGTIGSFTGAILTGFVLIPTLPITYIIIITMILISTISLILNPTGIAKFIAFGTVVIGIAMVLTIQTADGYVFETESMYSNIKVVDDDTTRMLLVDNSLQAVVTLGNPDPRVPFAKHMELSYFINPSIDDVLVLGLGSGTVTNILTGISANVDTVEIDSEIYNTAVNYFGYDGDVIIDDARHYIKNTPINYDLIVYDIAVGDSFPSHLYTTEAFAEAKSIMNDGIIAIHLDGDLNSKKLGSIYKTLRDNFDNVIILNGGDSTLSAKVFFATDREINPQDMKLNVDLSRHSNGMKYTYDNIIDNLVYEQTNGIILTDNYNPMDLWQAESAIKWREYGWQLTN